MELQETAYLLNSKTSKRKTLRDREWDPEGLGYYTLYPTALKTRLCLFWTLWAILVIVLVISILTYCCVTPYACRVIKGRLEASPMQP